MLKIGFTTTILYITIVVFLIPFTTHAYVFNSQLDFGDSGADVSALQQVLKDLNLFTHPTITGYFGSVTQTSVQAFQLVKGIASSGTPDTTGYGRVGPATRVALNGLTASSSNATDTPTFYRDLHVGLSGEDVKQLQFFLKIRGFFTYPTNTGFFGNATKAAVVAFQRANGINPIGSVGPLTRAKIDELSIVSKPTTSPPSIPALLKIDRVRSYELVLSWSAVDGAISYIIKRKQVGMNDYIVVGTATTTSYTDTSVSSRTNYSYVVTASNAGGESSPSPIVGAYTQSPGGGGGSSTPTLTPSDMTVPTVSMSVPSDSSTVSGSSVTLTASASDSSGIASVQFAVDGTDVGSEDISDPYSITWDSTTITDGSHSFTAHAIDTVGNEATSTTVTVTVDNTAPNISSISETITSTTTASIIWTTDEFTDSQIEYGLTDSYSSTTTLDETLVTSHSIALSGLLPDYTYHYRVLSTDAQGNATTSSDQTLSTLSAYGAGTFFADTFERDNTSPSTTPGSVGNSWIDKAGSTYFVDGGKLKSTDYTWEETLYRSFTGQDWSGGNIYGFVDIDDASASSTRILLAYEHNGDSNEWRSHVISLSPNSGFRNMGVGSLFGVSTYAPQTVSFTHFAGHVYRLEFWFTGSNITGQTLDMADPDNPIVLATKTRSQGSSIPDVWNVLGIGGDLPISQLTLSNTIPSWSTTTVAYNNSAIYYSPNTWYNTGSSYRTVNPGAYAKFKFTGTRLAIDLTTKTANDYIEWQIDGGEYKTHESPLQMTTMSLAQGLEDTTHDITIWFRKPVGYTTNRWGDTNTNSMEVTGFNIDSGETIIAPDTEVATALFYGDSITEAVVETGELNSSRQTWSAQLAGLMGVEYGQVGFSYQGWTYMLPATTVGTFPVSWQYYHATNSRISSGTFVNQPDYIFINEGQNDYSLGGNNPTAVTAAATSTITAIRAAAPSAKIFVVIPFTGKMRSAITTAFNNYQTDTPDSNCFLIDLGLNGPPDYDSSDGLHPTATGATYIAGLMKTAVDVALGL